MIKHIILLCSFWDSLSTDYSATFLSYEVEVDVVGWILRLFRLKVCSTLYGKTCLGTLNLSKEVSYCRIHTCSLWELVFVGAYESMKKSKKSGISSPSHSDKGCWIWRRWGLYLLIPVVGFPRETPWHNCQDSRSSSHQSSAMVSLWEYGIWADPCFHVGIRDRHPHHSFNNSYRGKSSVQLHTYSASTCSAYDVRFNAKDSFRWASPISVSISLI